MFVHGMWSGALRTLVAKLIIGDLVIKFGVILRKTYPLCQPRTSVVGEGPT